MYIHKGSDGEMAYVWGATKADAMRCLANPDNAELKLVKLPTSQRDVTTGASCASTKQETNDE